MSSLKCWHSTTASQRLSPFSWKGLTTSCYVFRKQTHTHIYDPTWRLSSSTSEQLCVEFHSLFLVSLIPLLLFDHFSTMLPCWWHVRYVPVHTNHLVLHSHHITSRKPICHTATLLTDSTRFKKKKKKKSCFTKENGLHLHPVHTKVQPFEQRVLGNLTALWTSLVHCWRPDFRTLHDEVYRWNKKKI